MLLKGLSSREHRRYLSAVLIARTPRFYLLALFGYVLHIPDYIIIAIIVVFVVAMNIPLMKSWIRR